MGSTIQVLIFIFPIMDTLDFAAPLETLTIPNRLGVSENKLFNIAIAAATPYITTSQGVVMQRHISIDEATERLEDFDILVAPGGRRTVVQELAVPGGAEFKLVKKFVQLSPKEMGPERIVLSICTGAFFLAAAGCFDGMQATTAKGALEALKEYVSSKDRTKIVSARFVDAGISAFGTRVITSGGISSGLDASLHVVEIRTSLEVARRVEDMLEYKWRRDEGVIVKP